MKTFRWMALLPFLLAGAAACDDFGLATDNKKDLGELRWNLERGLLTKGDGAEIPDTNDFLLSILDAQGKTLYEGSYGDSPEYLTVAPGSYTVSVKSIAFTSPAFARPQYGDEQTVVVKSQQRASVKLCCTLLNAGIKLSIAPGFLSAFPDGVLFVKQDDVRLKYLYSEKRIAYLKPGPASVLLYNEGKDQTLFTRNLSVREILSMNIDVANADGSGGIQISVDTSKVWHGEDFIIGGDNSGGSSQTPQAISVGEVPDHVGENGVWVYGYVVGGDLTSAGKQVKTSDFTKATHLALADRSSITAKSSCLAVELPKGKVRDALNLVDHPELVGTRIYVKGNLVSGYFGTKGLKSTSEYAFP